MTREALPISVIVPVKNEACNIVACLHSLAPFSEVFVVDSHSTDETAALAQAAGAQVVQFAYDGGWPKKKNWAIATLPLSHDWILIVDADERVSPALVEEMARAIRDPRINGYYMRWKFIFLGRWMKHSWSHGWMLRLFRKGTGAYEDLGMRDEGGWDNEVHENIKVTGKTAKLKNLLLHDSEQTLAFWLAKQNQFSTWNAKRRIRSHGRGPGLAAVFSSDPATQRAGLKQLYLKLPFRPVLMFLFLYIVRLGFLDGRAGYYFCALRAAHELNTEAKIFEAETLP